MKKIWRILFAFVLAIAPLVFTSRTNAANSYDFQFQFGGPGTEAGQFVEARDVATDSQGNIYVVDTNYPIARIEKFDSSGNYLTEFGSYGSDDGQFLSDTITIAIDPLDNIYVSDYGNNRVIKFDKFGVFVANIGQPVDIDNLQPGELSGPWGVAVNASFLYVVDNGTNQVFQYTTSGVFVRQWGTTGTSDGEFEYPLSDALDSLGNVYVIDTTNMNIQKFTSAGVFMRQWGSYDVNGGQGKFDCLRDMAISPDNRVFVLDNCLNVIQEFDTDGNWIGQFGQTGSGNGEFSFPLGIWANNYSLYVSDGGDYNFADVNGYNDRVEVFYLSASPSPTPSPTPSSSPTPNPGGSGSSNQSGSTSGAGTPICTNGKPGIPFTTSFKGPKSGQVTLFWAAPFGLVSDYTIAYSDNLFAKKWGVPSTGNVRTYTISNLKANTNYYFWVYAKNGCMPGDPALTIPTKAISRVPFISAPIYVSKPSSSPAPNANLPQFIPIQIHKASSTGLSGGFLSNIVSTIKSFFHH